MRHLIKAPNGPTLVADSVGPRREEAPLGPWGPWLLREQIPTGLMQLAAAGGMPAPSALDSVSSAISAWHIEVPRQAQLSRSIPQAKALLFQGISG